ncbi:hypothetical protein GRF29_8g132586 [Pseudopithomyces chartarum]|uniref:Uncharacterized protein n=1 Tax=Pseudopithomyces chartarum TaxID=1892770 RepID=A0AAN6M477_9PLEO|nr:hypothetical protein GRF29_8g132586 [Pseudopithomyces chartarum]
MGDDPPTAPNGASYASATPTPTPEPAPIPNPNPVPASTPAPASASRPATEPRASTALSPEENRVQILRAIIALYNNMLRDRDRQGHPRSSIDSVRLGDRIYNAERQLYEAIRANPPRTEQVNTAGTEPSRRRRVTFGELPRRD